MTGSLWRRNVVGAAIAACALVISIEAVVKPAWENYQRTVRPAHVAAAGRPVVVDGQTWTLRNFSRSTRQPGYGAPLPPGTVMVNAQVERSGTPPDGFGCQSYVLDANRSWRASIGSPCGEQESMTWSFLIPADAEPTAIDVRKLDRSILIRFEL